VIRWFVALPSTFAGVTPALAADGSLDPSFGTGGKMITNFGPMMTWAMTSLCNRGESRARQLEPIN
jgi:hypothetical protein